MRTFAILVVALTACGGAGSKPDLGPSPDAAQAPWTPPDLGADDAASLGTLTMLGDVNTTPRSIGATGFLEHQGKVYFGAVKDWPISAEPAGLPSFTTRLPLAWRGNSAWARPVTASG